MHHIYENLFTQEEIAALEADCDSRPIAAYNNEININKNLDYYHHNGISNSIIKPKLEQIFGADCVVAQGCYKIDTRPLGTHIDNAGTLYKWEENELPAKYEAAMIIPLVENENFRTVIYDVFSKDWHGMSEPLPVEYETGTNDFDLAALDHIAEPAREQTRRFNIDAVFSWKIGSSVVWEKNQLHCSTNYAKFGLQKKFVLLFIA